MVKCLIHFISYHCQFKWSLWNIISKMFPFLLSVKWPLSEWWETRDFVSFWTFAVGWLVWFGSWTSDCRVLNCSISRWLLFHLTFFIHSKYSFIGSNFQAPSDHWPLHVSLFQPQGTQELLCLHIPWAGYASCSMCYATSYWLWANHFSKLFPRFQSGTEENSLAFSFP